jgi:hypothetical protein
VSIHSLSLPSRKRRFSKSETKHLELFNVHKLYFSQSNACKCIWLKLKDSRRAEYVSTEQKQRATDVPLESLK